MSGRELAGGLPPGGALLISPSGFYISMAYETETRPATPPRGMEGYARVRNLRLVFGGIAFGAGDGSVDSADFGTSVKLDL
jgi:hypothetical protein